jgi:hypothetical protein
MSVRCQVIEENGTSRVVEIHKVVVHRFMMGDVDDPDLYAAQPLWEWEKSEAGQYVMEHAIDNPEWHRNISHLTMGHEYAIIAELEKKKLSEFYLKFGKVNA